MYEPDEMGEFMEKAEPYAKVFVVVILALLAYGLLVYRP